MIFFETKLEIPQPIKDTIATILKTLFDFDIEVLIKRKTKKRSLSSNSYFHLLKSELAKKEGASDTYMHNLLLIRYGELEIIDGNVFPIILRDDINFMELDMHLKPTGKTKILDDGKTYQVFLALRGSHTYNTKEMSVLIDGTVEDCKESGINTKTPNEIHEMMERWGIDYEKTNKRVAV